MKLRHALRRLAAGVALAATGLAVSASPAHAAPPVASGVVHRIVSNFAGTSSFCLGARSFNPGVTLIAARCDDPTNEILRRWIPQNLDGDATYRFSLWAISHCAAIGGARRDSGAKAIQWNCVNSAEQQWRLVPVPDGWFLMINVNSNLCLTWTGGEASQSPCDQAFSFQRWRFVPL